MRLDITAGTVSKLNGSGTSPAPTRSFGEFEKYLHTAQILYGTAFKNIQLKELLGSETGIKKALRFHKGKFISGQHCYGQSTLKICCIIILKKITGDDKW